MLQETLDLPVTQGLMVRKVNKDQLVYQELTEPMVSQDQQDNLVPRAMRDFQDLQDLVGQ